RGPQRFRPARGRPCRVGGGESRARDLGASRWLFGVKFSPARTLREPTRLPATARRLSSKLDGLCLFSAPMLLDPHPGAIEQVNEVTTLLPPRGMADCKGR